MMITNSSMLLESTITLQMGIIKREMARWEKRKQKRCKKLEKTEEEVNKITEEIKYQNTQYDPGDWYEHEFWKAGLEDVRDSMMITATIWPFIERLLAEIFEEIYAQTKKPRIKRVKGEGHADKIIREIKHLEYQDYMPENFEIAIQALYKYRNNMFHNGLLWPVKERTRFQEATENHNWSKEWFSGVYERKEGEDIGYLITLSEDFIEYWNRAIKQILTAFDEYVQKQNKHHGMICPIIESEQIKKIFGLE